MNLFRVDDYLISQGEWVEPRVGVSIHAFEVTKETPCGYWIACFTPRWRWVSKTSKKRFAYPTKEEAVKSFRCRKGRQMKILRAKLKRAETAFDMDEKDFLDCTEPLTPDTVQLP